MIDRTTGKKLQTALADALVAHDLPKDTLYLERAEGGWRVMRNGKDRAITPVYKPVAMLAYLSGLEHGASLVTAGAA